MHAVAHCPYPKEKYNDNVTELDPDKAHVVDAPGSFPQHLLQSNQGRVHSAASH